MTIGYILIVSILLLGGVLATAGDRIGTKVGKARLSLFNLRPKKTATLVTIITGVTISASTLGILFATSEPLRKGVFEYDQTQKRLRRIRKDLENANIEKTKVEAELSKAQANQSAAQQRLDATNWSLKAALGKLDDAIDELASKEEQLKNSQNQLSQTLSQKQALQEEIKQRQAERQELLDQLEQGKIQIYQQNQKIEQRNEEIAQQNLKINEKNSVISQQNQEINQQNQEIDTKNSVISQQNQEINQQNQDIIQKTAELAQKNQEVTQKNQEIEQKNQVIAQLETRFQELENQQAFLEREVQTLDREFQQLQVGTIVLRRGQLLVSGVVRVIEPLDAPQVVEQFLQQANEAATKITQPGTTDFNEQVIQITPVQIEELINKINDGQEYVVRILSAANYLLGETRVQIFVDAPRNRVVFMPGDVLAATSVDSKNQTPDQIRERIELLLVASNFQARRVGIVAETAQIGDGSIQTLIRFLEQLQQQKQPVDIKAIVAEVTYTAGPLKMELVAIKNGQVIFQTCRPGSGNRQSCA